MILKRLQKLQELKKLVKFIAGEDCGCDERKNKLNKIFRHNKLECLTEDEYNYLTAFFAKNKNILNNEDIKRLYEISNRIFNKNNKPSSCSSCVRTTVLRLKKIVDAY